MVRHPFLFIIVASAITTPLFYLVVGQNTRYPVGASVMWESVILAWWSMGVMRRDRGR